MYTSFFIFRTRLYLGFIFSELICIASGLGAYPEISDPQPGCGPTRNFELLDAKYSTNYVYNFNCIESVDIMKVESISTVRGAIRIWNMTIQYWIAEYVYRRLPIKKIENFSCIWSVCFMAWNILGLFY